MKRFASPAAGSSVASASSTLSAFSAFSAAVTALLLASELVLVAVFGGGCTEAPSKIGVRTGETEPTAKTDVHTDKAVLKLLPGLGEQPTHVWWSEQTVGESGGLGPTDRVLLVLLRFSDGSAERAISQLDARPKDATTRIAVSAFTHFPSEARSGLQLDSEDPEFYRLSGPLYEGTGVGRSPYLDGFVARIDNDRVLVRLFTH